MKFIRALFLFCLSILAASCTTHQPVLQLSPSPYHLLTDGEMDKQSDLVFTLLLPEKDCSSKLVEVDVMATARYGTQTLAARQPMTFIGCSREGDSVYQLSIPGFRIDGEGVEDLRTDEIKVYLRVSTGDMKQEILEFSFGLSQGGYAIEALFPIYSSVVDEFPQFQWVRIGYTEYPGVEYQIKICPAESDAGLLTGRCEVIAITSLDLQKGEAAVPDSLQLDDGIYQWALVFLDENRGTIYQSVPAEFVLDKGRDDWVGLQFQEGVVSVDGSVVRVSDGQSLEWQIFRNGELTSEQPITADAVEWNIESLVAEDGFYEILVVKTDTSGKSNIVSNVVKFAGTHKTDPVDIQAEYAISAEEETNIRRLVDTLMKLPEDRIQTFLNRLVFQGIIQPQPLRNLLKQANLEEDDLRLMIVQSRTDELVGLFAQAYKQNIIDILEVQTALDEFLESE